MKNLATTALLICSFFCDAQRPDSLIIKQIDSLLVEAQNSNRSGNAEKALEEAEKATALAREQLGEMSLSYAQSIGLTGVIFFTSNQLNKAEKCYLDAHEINRKLKGEDSEEYATSCYNLSLLYQKMNRFEEAEPLAIKALDLRRKILGEGHPEFGKALGGLGNLYIYARQFGKAEPIIREWVDFNEKNPDKGNLELAKSLGNLSMVYRELAKYELAESAALKSLEIYEKNVGKETESYIRALSYLATFYGQTAQYAKAEPALLEVVELQGKVAGKDNLKYASYIVNLSTLYKYTGQFEKAEQYALEAKSIFEKLGPDPYYASFLDNFGILYNMMGQYEKAENLMLEAQNMRVSLLGKSNIDYGKSLLNLGTHYWETQRLDKAEANFKEALQLFKDLKLTRHPGYAIALENLGVIYRLTDRLREAEPLMLESLSVLEDLYGKDNPEYAASLNNLAGLYYDVKDYEQAEKRGQDALNIRRSTLGNFHQDHLTSMNFMGQLYFEWGKLEKAGIYLDQSEEILQKLLNDASLFMSAEEFQNYQAKHQDKIDQTISFTMAVQADNPERVKKSFQSVINSKGSLIEQNLQLKNLISTLGPEALAEFSAWQQSKARLAEHYTAGMENSEEVMELEENANTLEKKLVKTVAGFGSIRKEVDWTDLQNQLEKSEAIIEFLNFRFFNPEITDSIYYAALILRPGWEAPKWVTLFEEKQLQPLLGKEQLRKAEYVTYLFENQDPSSLYDLIWKPLEGYLEGVQHIYFSPSGLLHRIPIAAVKVNENETISDRFALHQLGSTRQMMERSSLSESNNEAIVFGGVQYEMDSTAMVKANEQLTIEVGYISEIGSQDLRALISGDKTWKYLPWTEVEAKTIDAILTKGGMSGQLYLGYAATEEIFRSIGDGEPSPRVLHIATHGFFFSETERRASDDKGEPVFMISPHPMIRSGLILAGANYTWGGGGKMKNLEDGILTAYEVSQMNLSNTELVVLSACETGLGDIEGNEGVYGLQRAFKIAGAKYLLMSLWQVPDFITQELMTTFYSNWLTQKMNIPEAFRAAQQNIKIKRPEPFYWAGFVLVE